MRHCPDVAGCATLPRPARVWHEAFCRWYDHDRAGNTHRAALWGWIADRIVRWA